MKEIKYRQPIFCEGKFSYWHYWGDVKGGFLSPVNANLKRDSQQCTGLKDRLGKEIFEGDLIIHSSRNSNEPHPVIFNKESASWCGDYELKYSLQASELDEVEVIGNMYERGEI